MDAPPCLDRVWAELVPSLGRSTRIFSGMNTSNLSSSSPVGSRFSDGGAKVILQLQCKVVSKLFRHVPCAFKDQPLCLASRTRRSVTGVMSDVRAGWGAAPPPTPPGAGWGAGKVLTLTKSEQVRE